MAERLSAAEGAGWLYLAVVMDLFSRKIVAWSAGPTIHRELVLDALRMAVRRRRPRGTLIHSDQGTQFGCDVWRRFCRSHLLQPSISRKGKCWDNAVAESFFSSLKKERIKKQIDKNLGQPAAQRGLPHADAGCGRHDRRFGQERQNGL
jgi:putative transposase